MGSEYCPCNKVSPKNVNNPQTMIYNGEINDKNNYKNTNLNSLANQYNNIKIKNKIFYDDIEKQEMYIENYKLFLSELNYQINNLIDNLNISLNEINYYEKILNQGETNELLNEIGTISDKINEFNDLLEQQKTELKSIKNIYKLIQEQFNQEKYNYKLGQVNSEFLRTINKDYIKQLISQSENIEQNLSDNKIKYDKKKENIENYIKNIKYITEEKIKSIKNKTKMYLSYMSMDETVFSKSTSLLAINDFSKESTMFKKNLIQHKEELKEIQKLIKFNYNTTCYINDNYDIYEINYDLKAVGLNNMTSNSSFYAFPIDVNVEIILFEIDGKSADYIREKYSIRFDIKLKNLEINKIHIIYKEFPLYEKSISSLYRRKSYGISHRLGGRDAEFNLINKSNMEIISFADEFFFDKGNNEYYWKGKVPVDGKETKIILSKKEAEVNFYEKYTITTTNNSSIGNVLINIPFCYKDGNYQEIIFKKRINPKIEIKSDENRKIYEMYFMDLKSEKITFNIEGKVINRCKGEWIINLTNEEIETLIPQEFKDNKEAFKQISEKIIKQYDEQHKDDLINVPKVAKIGKWVNKHIIYDITYIGLNDIPAMETYNSRKGVCHHKTKLFNALMYSLGYQVLYLLGFAVYNKKNFSIENSHCWSLIKIDGKWLPYDATWGIFSGKLPVTHIFKRFNYNNLNVMCNNDKVYEQIYVKGNII